MIIKHKKSHKSLFIAIAVIAVIFVVSGAYLLYAKANNHWPFPTSVPISSNSPSGPASSSNTGSKNSSDTTYDKNKGTTEATGQSASTDSDSAKASVSVGVTSAATVGDNVEVRADVRGVIEGTGTCTATLLANGASVTGTSLGFVNATSTQCETISIPKSRVNNGTWMVTVSYDSPTSSGASPSLEASL